MVGRITDEFLSTRGGLDVKPEVLLERVAPHRSRGPPPPGNVEGQVIGLVDTTLLGVWGLFSRYETGVQGDGCVRRRLW